jgi:hypothetical protein
VTPELKRNRPARPAPASRREFRLVCLLDRALGALVKLLARLGRGEPARRPEQQPDAEALFKLGDGLGDSGLSDAEQSRGAGERAGFDYADEHLHRGQAIHGHSSKECILSLGAASAIRKEQTI